jgi:hypothetical protein
MVSLALKPTIHSHWSAFNRFKVPEFVARYKGAAQNAVKATKRPTNNSSEGPTKKKQKV